MISSGSQHRPRAGGAKSKEKQGLERRGSKCLSQVTEQTASTRLPGESAGGEGDGEHLDYVEFCDEDMTQSDVEANDCDDMLESVGKAHTQGKKAAPAQSNISRPEGHGSTFHPSFQQHMDRLTQIIKEEKLWDDFDPGEESDDGEVFFGTRNPAFFDLFGDLQGEAFPDRHLFLRRENSEGWKADKAGISETQSRPTLKYSAPMRRIPGLSAKMARGAEPVVIRRLNAWPLTEQMGQQQPKEQKEEEKEEPPPQSPQQPAQAAKPMAPRPPQGLKERFRPEALLLKKCEDNEKAQALGDKSEDFAASGASWSSCASSAKSVEGFHGHRKYTPTTAAASSSSRAMRPASPPTAPAHVPVPPPTAPSPSASPRTKSRTHEASESSGPGSSAIEEVAASKSMPVRPPSSISDGALTNPSGSSRRTPHVGSISNALRRVRSLV